MNDIDNLDYSIQTTLKNNKLQIEYKGKIFKENPSMITKNTSKVNVIDTLDGFKVEIDVTKGNEFDFAINNINTEEIKNNMLNKKEEVNLSQITDLTIIEKTSLWRKFVHYLKKLTKIGFLGEGQKEKNM